MSEYKSIWMWLKDVAFTQSFIDVDGIRTRVLTAGPASGEAIVLLHGTGGHWEAYAPTIRPLTDAGYRVIAPDLVGNGFSGKPDYPYTTHVYVKHVTGVLDALGVRKTHLAGMSLGAWVAARFALEQPERTGKVILMSPAGLLARASNMERIKRQRTAAVTNPEWDTIKAMFDHLIADEDNKIPDIIALRQSIYREPATLATIDHILALQELSTRTENLLTEDEWRSIDAPVLVVASGKDHAEYESTSRQILRLLPRSEVLEMPHVAHWPSFEDPDTFNAAALKFLSAVTVRSI